MTTRNTHDAALDHHGTAVAEQVATGTATSGFVPVSAGPGVSPAWGAMAGGTSYPDLLTGDDSTFAASLGSWTNSGGTMTRDTTALYKWASGSAASMKYVTTTLSQYVELALAGTFKAGTIYEVMIAGLTEELPSGFNALGEVAFGLIGTDSVAGNGYFDVFTAGAYVTAVARWVPSADRTGVKVRFTRKVATASGTLTYHLGIVRVASAPNYELSSFNVASPPLGIVQGALGLTVLPGAQSTYLGADGGGTRGVRFDNSGAVSFQSLGGNGYIGVARDESLFAHGGTTHGDLSVDGLQLQVGDDYVTVQVAEKDASTAQITGSGNDIELRDQVSATFKTADGTRVSALSLLHHILVGTADPTAGGGVAHPQPAIYLRDNSGTTELWTTTGTGTTAWQKVTIP
jgi:hypothetical protein